VALTINSKGELSNFSLLGLQINFCSSWPTITAANGVEKKGKLGQR